MTNTETTNRLPIQGAVDVSPAAPPIVVHLVHGTWPFGPWRRSSGRIKAWFEEGSVVRGSIAREAGCAVDFRVFRWSGRNSFRARAEASRLFIHHMDAALTERADTKHVIIAHSHGGTVASQALASVHIPGVPRVRALICIATPFTYLTPTDKDVRDTLPAAFIAVAMALAVVAAMQWSNFPASLNAWLALAIWPMLTVIITVLLSLLELGKYPEWSFASLATIHAAIPVFLMRATRDEAALLIGMAQSVQFVTSRYGDYEDNPPPIWRMRRAVPYAMASIPFVIASLFLLPLVATDVVLSSNPHMLLVGLVLMQGLSGLVPVLGHAALAMATGLWNPRYWLKSTIEVDAAPQGKECSFKAYSDLPSIGRSSLRHGLYEHPEVQEEIGSVIRAIAAGNAPRLITREEFDAEADRKRGATKLLEIFGRDDLAWGDLPDGVQPVIREDMFKDGKPFVLKIPL